MRVIEVTEWEWLAILRGLSSDRVAINAAERNAVEELREKILTTQEAQDAGSGVQGCD